MPLLFKDTVALETSPTKTAETVSYGATLLVLAGLLLANFANSRHIDIAKTEKSINEFTVVSAFPSLKVESEAETSAIITPDIVLGFALNNTTADAGTDHVLVGTALINDRIPLSIPDPTIETHNIDRGTWNNPIEDNWVVVTTQAEGMELQTSNHLAMIDPTPVANLTGTATYGSTAASSFIGSGSSRRL